MSDNGNPAFDKISDFLDIENASESPYEDIPEGALVYTTPETQLAEIEENLPAPVKIPTNPDVQEDFNLARQNILDMIAMAKVVLDDVVQLGRSLESARPYEVANQLIKNVVDANKDLLDMHKKVKEVNSTKEEKDSGGGTTTNVQNNVVFAGSTAELQKFLKEQNNK